MNEHIEIINTGDSPATTILLNGVDISELVSKVCFQQTGGEFPTVQLDFVAGAVHIKSHAVIQYPKKFFDAMSADKNRSDGGSYRVLEKIRNLCEEAGTNIAKLERDCGLANATIRRWDVNSPSAENLAKVADHFGASVDYLLGRTPSGCDE